MIYEYGLSDMNVSAGNLHCDLNNKADWAYKMLQNVIQARSFKTSSRRFSLGN